MSFGIVEDFLHLRPDHVSGDLILQHTIIIAEFLEQISESCWDDIRIVAPIAALPLIKRCHRLGVVAPFSEFRTAKAAGLLLSLWRAPDLTEDLLPGVFLIIRHTIIISEFLPVGHVDRIDLWR